MTDVSVTAERVDSVHNVPIQIGMDYFDAKFDTGSMDADEILGFIDELVG